MKSMTGYGRGEAGADGVKFTVEVHAVNRKQTDVSVLLPKEFAELEQRVLGVVHHAISRGRLNVNVGCSNGTPGQFMELDIALARRYHEGMTRLQKELKLGGEIGVEILLRAPGVMRVVEERTTPEQAWPLIESALREALEELVRMRAKEGKHLAKDLIHRLKTVRQTLRRIRQLHSGAVKRHADALRERIAKAGLQVAENDERLLREIVYFADRSDISEEITRLESHLAQFAHHLRRDEPVGRPLDFLTQEINRELNTLGSKANDAEISHHVVACKSEMEKIREQVQNIE